MPESPILSANGSSRQLNPKVTVGVDEAGRGPLAGPVVASAVILNPLDIPEGLRDSKKLSEKRRNILAVEIKAKALAIGVGIVHEQDIDRKNILQATFEAMRQAISNLDYQFTLVQVDGNHKIPGLQIEQEAIIGGDDLIPEISAASIIAKTTRDAMMISYDKLFPEYGFKSHKGYGSSAHMENLRELGPRPYIGAVFDRLIPVPIGTINTLILNLPTDAWGRYSLACISSEMVTRFLNIVTMLVVKVNWI